MQLNDKEGIVSENQKIQ